MRNSTLNASTTGGKHRKQSPNKGRVALVAVATGAVSTAGISGAAAATLQASPESSVADYELTNVASDVVDQVQQAAPQILAISEYKPTANVSEQLEKAVAASSERVEADLALRAPSVVKPAEGAFTSGYGPRWGTIHQGIDIAAPIGTPILAAMDGVVTASGPASGYGNWIKILHDDGSTTLYGHMSSLDVAVGQAVTAGQKIAGMGSEGFSTGSHLHFEYHPAGSGPVDPQPWLAQHGISL
ncbi:M23 family metallopeptidase [Corynebacterium lubricantis]|uniref:M23 family metallopeptidase n=1 Tax=Corynebacterium lubricantis TaxID=541095 RepID=UPI00037F22FE|nr:M23 family metallopeptidase [Corynebacterium lubricantis]